MSIRHDLPSRYRTFSTPSHVIETPISKDLQLPQVCVEVDGRLYPFGAEALIEGWTYGAVKALVAVMYGRRAATEYAERMKPPFFPYRVLEWVIQRICPEASVLTDPMFSSFLSSILAYYGLSGGPFDPDSESVGHEWLPGFRAASLAERLQQFGAKSRAAIFDACDQAMLLDRYAGWRPFVINAYETHDSVVAYMSRATGHGTWHLKTVNLAPFAWFTDNARTEIQATLMDTGILFDVREWLRDYHHARMPRPPISLFFVDVGDRIVPDLRSMLKEGEERDAYLTWYVFGSIVQEKRTAPTFRCPLSRGGTSACPYFDDEVCEVQFNSLSEVPEALATRDCPLRQMLSSTKIVRESV